MMKMYRLIFLVSIFFCFGCSDREPEITPRPYSRIKTLPVKNITASGALFEGEVVFVAGAILESGFVWSESQLLDPRFSQKIVNSESIGETRPFAILVERNLKSNVTYYMCAYLKSGDTYVLGNVEQFISLGSKNP
jgi:hypothetical protein